MIYYVLYVLLCLVIGIPLESSVIYLFRLWCFSKFFSFLVKVICTLCYVRRSHNKYFPSWVMNGNLSTVISSHVLWYSCFCVVLFFLLHRATLPHACIIAQSWVQGIFKIGNVFNLSHYCANYVNLGLSYCILLKWQNICLVSSSSFVLGLIATGRLNSSG